MDAEGTLAREVVERTRALLAEAAGGGAPARSRGSHEPAAGASVAVAVSGGGDSVALAVMLAEAGLARALVHVDHALRPESAEDAEAVRALGGALDVAVLHERVEVRAVAETKRLNLADAARRIRLEVLHRLAKRAGASAIVLAHTLDDQAETVLLQLLRGSATLRGMPARRGRLLRPALGVRRAALRAFLRERDVAWREDPGNVDPLSRRARVRHELLPAMEAIAPGASERLARHALVQRDVQAFLTSEAVRRVRTLARAWERDEDERGAADRGADGGVEVDARTLAALPPALQREALALLMRAEGAAVDLVHLEEARAAMTRREPWRLSLGGGRSLHGAYGRVAVTRARDPREAEAPRPVARAEDLPPGVDPAVLEGGGELELRTRRPGDWIRLPGGRRSVADLLIDRRVPRARRDALRVLARGDEVLWIEAVATAVGAGADAGVVLRDEERWMRRALELARVAADAGETPVGAVVALDAQVVGEGSNRSETDVDPSAHAEMLALRAAAAARGDWRLAGATLVVTLEPCPMCFGAALQAHVGRIVFGARNLREGALGGVADLSTERWKRDVAIEGGLLERESSALLSAFFGRRRATSPAGRGRRNPP